MKHARRLGPDALELLDRFDQAWHGDTPPRLEDFLSLFSSTSGGTDAAARKTFLEELVKIDLEHCWRRKTTSWDLEEYVKRHPELGPLSRLPIELIVEEYRVRQEWGDHPAHADYLKRFAAQGPLLEGPLAQVDAELAAELARNKTVQSGSPP